MGARVVSSAGSSSGRRAGLLAAGLCMRKLLARETGVRIVVDKRQRSQNKKVEIFQYMHSLYLMLSK